MKLSDRVFGDDKLLASDHLVSLVDREREAFIQEAKARMHYKVLNVINLEKLNADTKQYERELEQAIKMVLESESAPLTAMERETLIRQIKHEVLGLGPIEPLINDPTVNDILVNGFNNVFVERRGVLEKVNIRFKDDAHLEKIIDKIAASVGRRIDESSPMVDARLADGSRVNAIIPPLAIDGPMLSIRKFSVDPYTADDLIRLGTINKAALSLLEACVKARLNVVVSGGTGSGKTTFLNVLSSFISAKERIITIEDAAELQLQQSHVGRLETRPSNIEGTGEVTTRQLLRNSLRMRPDRIIVGEVRGGEALDMMQAMNTGHDGSLTTIHANSPRDALSRLETMISMAGFDIPDKAIRQQITSAIQVVIQLARLMDGSRRVVSIQEITGIESDMISMQEIFKFQQTGIDERGKVLGVFGPTGLRLKNLDKISSFGIRLDNSIFQRSDR